jgi:hypothetical protein
MLGEVTPCEKQKKEYIFDKEGEINVRMCPLI